MNEFFVCALSTIAKRSLKTNLMDCENKAHTSRHPLTIFACNRTESNLCKAHNIPQHRVIERFNFDYELLAKKKSFKIELNYVRLYARQGAEISRGLFTKIN